MKYLLLLSITAICAPVHNEWHAPVRHDPLTPPPYEVRTPATETPAVIYLHPDYHPAPCYYHPCEQPHSEVPEPGSWPLVGGILVGLYISFRCSGGGER